MKIVISGKHMDVGDSLREHVDTALRALVGRFVEDAVEGQVVFEKKSFQFHCELSLHVSRHFVVRTRCDDSDPYRAFELALNKMESRMTRYRSRLRNRKRHQGDDFEDSMPAQRYVINNDEGREDEAEQDTPLIIAEMESEVPTVTVSEAVMRMDLGEHQTLMFKNQKTGQFNVVYRRADGNIGWIDPSLRR